MAVPATATAMHVFDDVDDAKFYAGPIEWALNNDITTGSPAGADTFKPEDPVTRGESVTFLKRYHDNIVQPGLADVQADVDALATMPALHWAQIAADGTVISSSAGAPRSPTRVHFQCRQSRSPPYSAMPT